MKGLVSHLVLEFPVLELVIRSLKADSRKVGEILGTPELPRGPQERNQDIPQTDTTTLAQAPVTNIPLQIHARVNTQAMMLPQLELLVQLEKVRTSTRRMSQTNLALGLPTSHRLPANMLAIIPPKDRMPLDRALISTGRLDEKTSDPMQDISLPQLDSPLDTTSVATLPWSVVPVLSERGHMSTVSMGTRLQAPMLGIPGTLQAEPIVLMHLNTVPSFPDPMLRTLLTC
jgi:hypothetical protein